MNQTRSNAATSELVKSRALALASLTAAAWPVLRWYTVRLSDGSDEPWGLFALLAAVFLAPRSGWLDPLSPGQGIALGGALLLYTFSFSVLPALMRAVAFVSAVGAIAAPRDYFLAWSALLTLSLPWTATLQFYLGYPLRWATAGFDASLLRLVGIAAKHEATTVFWAGEQVVVDAPCSGVQMLWAGWLLSALFACNYKLPTRVSIWFFAFSTLAILLANGFRTAALFCFETRLWPTFPWYHEGSGLAFFAVSTVLIFVVAERLSGERRTAAGQGHSLLRGKILTQPAKL